MAIAQGYKDNFNTLLRAASNEDLCIMECIDKGTGKPVTVVCASYEEGDEIVMVPLAKMFDGNPYDELEPPL